MKPIIVIFLLQLNVLLFSQNNAAYFVDSTNITIQYYLLFPQKCYIYLYPELDKPIDSIVLKFGDNSKILKFNNLDLFAIEYNIKDNENLFFFLCEKNLSLTIECSLDVGMHILSESNAFKDWEKEKTYIDSMHNVFIYLTGKADRNFSKKIYDKIADLQISFIDTIYLRVCNNPGSFGALYAFYFFRERFIEHRLLHAYRSLSQEMQDHRIGKLLHTMIEDRVFLDINEIISVSICMIDSSKIIKPPKIIENDSTFIIVHFWKYLNNYGINNTKDVDSLLSANYNKNVIFFSVFIGDNMHEVLKVLSENEINMRTYIVPLMYYDKLFCKYTLGSSVPHDVIFENKNTVYQRFSGIKKISHFLNNI